MDEAGIDIALVGDSLAMTMLGYENTLSVTVDEMLHHVKAVRRGVKDALLIADMPYGSYQVDPKDAIQNAARFVKEGGAEAVKMEGGEKRVDVIRRVIDAEIPVAGHIGLTPQSINVMGGYKVQGKTLDAIEQLMRDAVALDRAGVACIYLEGIPREVAAMITAEVEAPTIGIGAGPDCDGQVLVFHDLVNLTFGQPAKFVRRYGDAAAANHAISAGVQSRRGFTPVSERQRELPPAEGNAGGTRNGTSPQAGHAAIMAGGENVVRPLRSLLALCILFAALAACSKPPAGSRGQRKRRKPTGLESIPMPDPAKYPSISDMSGWKNPYLIVREDGIGIVDLSNREIHMLKPEEVPAELVVAAVERVAVWPRCAGCAGDSQESIRRDESATCARIAPCCSER